MSGRGGQSPVRGLPGRVSLYKTDPVVGYIKIEVMRREDIQIDPGNNTPWMVSIYGTIAYRSKLLTKTESNSSAQFEESVASSARHYSRIESIVTV